MAFCQKANLKPPLPFKDLHFDQVYIHDVFYASIVKQKCLMGYIFDKLWLKNVL